MADRLTQAYDTDKVEPIHKQLLHLIAYILLTICLLAAAAATCLIMNYRVMENYSNQNVLIGDFMTSVNQAGYALNTYVNSGRKEDFMSLEEAQHTMVENLQGISAMEIMNANVRSIEDLSALVEAFADKKNRVCTQLDKMRPLQTDASYLIFQSDEYTQAQQILTWMSEDCSRLFPAAHDAIVSLRSRMKQQEKKYFILLFLTSAAMIVYSVYQVQRTVRQITDPIRGLTQQASRIVERDIEQVNLIGSRPDDSAEIILLTKAFNVMILTLQEQIRELKRTAYLKTNEVRRLQSQINSHFLFNTLSMITQTAYLENADKTVELMQETAKLLRYSLDNSERKVTMRQEMEELGHYVYLQEQRFGKRLRFYFDLDEAHHDLYVPSLILQPIIENAITHGVGMRKEGGSIHVCTHLIEEENCLAVSVEDNGDGMTQEETNELMSRLDSAPSDYDTEGAKRIGLENISRRLALFYNGKAHILVHSEKNIGTRVELRLPYKETDQTV